MVMPCALIYTKHAATHCITREYQYYLQGGPFDIPHGSRPRGLILQADDITNLELHSGGQLRVLIVLVKARCPSHNRRLLEGLRNFGEELNMLPGCELNDQSGFLLCSVWR